MDMMNSIADMATSMNQAQVSMQLSTTMLKRAMDTESSAAQALFDSFAQTTAQAFPGDNGYLFDARA